MLTFSNIDFFKLYSTPIWTKGSVGLTPNGGSPSGVTPNGVSPNDPSVQISPNAGGLPPALVYYRH